MTRKTSSGCMFTALCFLVAFLMVAPLFPAGAIVVLATAMIVGVLQVVLFAWPKPEEEEEES